MGKSTSLIAGLIVCVVCLGAILVLSPLSETVAVSESQAYGELGLQDMEDPLAASHLSTALELTPSFTVTLPLVMADYRYRPPCSPESPFSITIAAIHEVVPDEARDAPERALAEAQWLERIEEGFPTLVEALADSGACWTRVEVKWSDIQPEPPPAPYDFSWYDEKLQLLAGSGVQILVLVHNIPDWAGAHEMGPIDIERVPDFAQFLTDLVSRYQQPPYSIHHWELFNEPDLIVSHDLGLGWGEFGGRYAEMLKEAYPAIKEVDQTATVLMGGLAYDLFKEYFEDPDGYFYRYFPDDVMAENGEGFVDVTNFHYFTDFRLEWERWSIGDLPTCGILDDGEGTAYEAGGIDVIAKANHLRNRLRVCYGVDKPTWLTELAENGYADDPGSLGQQARYVIQGYARALAVGMENVTWFALVSPFYDPYEQGLLYEDDWSPKPAYYTYQTLAYELADYKYSRSLDVPKVEAYVFRNNNGLEKVVAWSSGEVSESGSLIFASASTLRVVDREGRVTFIQDGGSGDADQIAGSITFQLPEVPVDPNPLDHEWYTAEPLIISKW